MLDGRLLATESSQTPQPKYTAAKVGLGRGVVKEQPRFARESSYVKSILHQQEDIHVIRFRLGSDKRSENCAPGQVPCCLSQAVDAFQPHSHDFALGRATAEAGHGLGQSCAVDARRQVAALGKKGQGHKISCSISGQVLAMPSRTNRSGGLRT
jgi:hypothetical protein